MRDIYLKKDEISKVTFFTTSVEIVLILHLQITCAFNYVIFYSFMCLFIGKLLKEAKLSLK